MAAFGFPFASGLGSGFSFVPVPDDSSSVLSSLNPTPIGTLGGLGDQLINPETRDYVRTSNGEWAETADSRSIMLLMLELELGASPYTPDDGTTIKEALRSGDSITPEKLQAETVRAGAILAADGVLADLIVQVRDSNNAPLVDQAGRRAALCSWRDLASSSPINLLFTPG